MAPQFTAPHIVLDTDPGADDAIALIWLCALHHQGRIQLDVVSTVGGNVGVDYTTTNAARLLAVCQSRQTTLAKGRNAGGEQARHVHGHDGLAGLRETLPAAEDLWPDPPDAPALLAGRGANIDALIAIGPLTNLAADAALAATPPRRTVVMGGALGTGNITAHAEFNVHHDPESWRLALNKYQPDIVPLNITSQVHVDAARSTADRPGRLGAFVSALFRRMCEDAHRRTGQGRFLLHDAVAVAAACCPSMLSFRDAALDVVLDGERRGALVEHPDEQPNARVAWRVDAESLVSTMLEDIDSFCADLADGEAVSE